MVVRLTGDATGKVLTWCRISLWRHSIFSQLFPGRLWITWVSAQAWWWNSVILNWIVPWLLRVPWQVWLRAWWGNLVRYLKQSRNWDRLLTSWSQKWLNMTKYPQLLLLWKEMQVSVSGSMWVRCMILTINSRSVYLTVQRWKPVWKKVMSVWAMLMN